MNLLTIDEALKTNSYPGRGIIFGVSSDGDGAVMAYFIMGRSINSRNRVFIEDGKGIKTHAFDPSKLEDPSLIIYSPVRVYGNKTIITNGDQTDTIYNKLDAQMTFEESLRDREYEPDAPNYTPRISGIIRVDDDGIRYALSILKKAEEGTSCNRYFYTYREPVLGEGRLIHTYTGDGNPLPSYEGDPKRIKLNSSDVDELSKEIWDALDEDNRVSLFVRYINKRTRTVHSKIINKNVY